MNQSLPIDSAKKVINYKDLFEGDFWRYILRAIWLFFPAILFLIFAYFCFWELPQGKDVVIITLENKKVFGLFLLALIFWMIITWYTTRLVAKGKELMESNEHLLWLIIKVQAPRILAFTCITIVLLGIFQLPYPKAPHLSKIACSILFWLSFPYYFLLYQAVTRSLRQKNNKNLKAKISNWHKIRFATYTIIAGATLIVVLYRWVWGLVILLLLYQIGFIVFVLIRRNLIDINNDYSFQQPDHVPEKVVKLRFWGKLKLLVADKEDREYFIALNVISFFAAIIYFATIFSVGFSTWIGSFPFLLLAFGVLVGLGNAVALLSILNRFNFHVLFVTLAFLVGFISEPHYTRLSKKPADSAMYQNRQSLKEYFDHWLADSSRQNYFADSAKPYPVYFVMANGGASRSGYWAASVLSRIEDETQGKFSKHLFCLSGASGGSVGNATFFCLLKGKDRLLQKSKDASPLVKATRDYLKSDFLTFTLARTLGPDIFRNFITLYQVSDRASALSFALEKAPDEKVFLRNRLGTSFAKLMTQKGEANPLPLLYINTTRMQDGSPGVISNILVEDSVFNKRIDVLSLLDEKKDMKLSTAVVLGASFPYLSPAGRIDHKPCDTCKVEPNYFVDGGYFDNSGSGAVFETIFTLKQLLDRPEYAAYKNKIEFHIIHITNDPSEEIELKSVNPFTNDLASPIKTLLGAYGTQTSVNDFRLQKYIASINNEPLKGKHFSHLSLYKPKDSMDYTMSWVISKHVLNAMDERLYSYDKVTELVRYIRDSIPE